MASSPQPSPPEEEREKPLAAFVSKAEFRRDGGPPGMSGSLRTKPRLATLFIAHSAVEEDVGEVYEQVQHN